MPTHRWDNVEDASRDAYEAYCERCRWKDPQGNTLSLWAELSQVQKAGWGSATRRVLSKAYRIVASHLIEHIQEDCDENCAKLGKDPT